MQTEVSAATNNNSQSQTDLGNWTGNWIWRTVQSLAQSPEFSESPRWIAQQLNISVEKALDAIEGLERLGFMARVEGKLKVTESWKQITPAEVPRANLLAHFSKLAPQIITRVKPEDKFTSQFFLADEELVAECASKIMQAFKEMNDEALKRGAKDVYASEIVFAKMTQQGSNGGTR